MVANYRVENVTFIPGKATLWVDASFSDRGQGIRNFDLHPDGQRLAIVKGQDSEAQAKVNKVTFIFNFFEELRRITPSGK